MSSARAGAKVRVVTLVDGIGAYGGGERLAREIAIRLDQSRFETVFCVSRPVPAAELAAGRELIEGAGVRLDLLGRRWRGDLGTWLSTAGRYRRWGVDVLHSHKFGSNVWGAMLKGRMGSPAFVAHEHTWSFQGRPERKLLDRRLIAPRADAFVAVSGPDRERMIELERIPAAKVRLIANGIPDPPPPTPGRDLRRELGIAADAPLLGAVATLRPQKALDVLIRAVAALRPEFPEVVALVAGGDADRAERARLEGIAAAAGVADAIRLLGERDDVAELLAALDVAVLSSDFEGSPLSVMEYMEAGLPVVATRVGGLPDVVEDGVTGLLVPPRDPAALATAVAALLGDRERARRLGEAGRERRRRLFSVTATTRAVEALYEELLADTGPAGAGRA
jgi:glycosyltransferase involved in cell wall biosynthesis